MRMNYINDVGVT